VGEGGFFGNSLPSALITRHLEVAVRVELPGNAQTADLSPPTHSAGAMHHY